MMFKKCKLCGKIMTPVEFCPECKLLLDRELPSALLFVCFGIFLLASVFFITGLYYFSLPEPTEIAKYPLPGRSGTHSFVWEPLMYVFIILITLSVLSFLLCFGIGIWQKHKHNTKGDLFAADNPKVYDFRIVFSWLRQWLKR